MRPHPIRLACALVLLPAVSPAADWVLARSPGFVVVSDGGEEKARAYAHEFEQMRALFRELFKARVDPGRPVVVFALRDGRAMGELIGSERDRGRELPAGLYAPDVEKDFMVVRGDAQDERSIVYHEFTHLLARLNYRWLPLWLSEGLAEFYSTTDFDADAVRWGFIAGHHVSAVRGVRISLAELTSATRGSPVYDEGHRVGPFYAYSALLTHYLFFEPTRRGQLSAFLKLLAEDVPAAEAMRQAFGDLKKLENELWAYSRRTTFNGVKVKAALPDASVTAIKLKPHEVDSLRGDFLARRGASAEARRMLEGTLAVSPNDAIAHEGLGIVEAQAGRPREALRHFTEASRLSPRSAVGPFRLGLLTIPGDAGDRARREAALRSAIRINPFFANAHAALARVLLEGGGGGAAEAANLAARASALDPGTVYYRLLLWHALDRSGQKDKAAGIEASLRRGALGDPQTLGEMASYLEEIASPAEAEELLRKAGATNPAAAGILMTFLADHGRWDEALTMARADLARDPRSATHQNTVAYFQAEAGRDLPEALELIDRALKKSPRNPAYLDTKGVVLLRMKRFKDAETLLREAAALYEDAEVLDHLAEALAGVGKRDEAVRTYERALEMPGLTAQRRESIQSKLNGLRPASPG